MRRVRVFKVDGRWWWWCAECWGGDCTTETGARLLTWRAAYDLGRAHALARHPLRRSPHFLLHRDGTVEQLVAPVSEPPC